MSATDTFVGFEDGSETGEGRGRRLSLSADERATGMHVIGAPGTGKSKFLEFLIRQDIDDGHGLCLIDPHGVLYEDVVRYCARYRPKRPVYRLNVSKPLSIFGFNPFLPRPSPVSTRANRCLAAIMKAWGIHRIDNTTRLVRWVKNTFTVLLERKDLTVPEIEFLVEFSNGVAREYLTAGSSVEEDWKSLARKSPTDFDDRLESTTNRLSHLYRDVGIRRFMGLTDPSVNLALERLMDTGGVLLVNLQPSAYLDAINARVFGTMLVSEFFDVARQRKGARGRPPRPFYLYCDEAQNYITPDVAEILAQGRKMGLSLILAHQFLEQLTEEDPRILAALNGACRTKVAFGLGSNGDATALVHELFPGQIDYNEVKRIDYAVKFWPVYGRDQARTTTKGGGRAHTEGTSSGTTGASGHSSVDTLGMTRPDLAGLGVDTNSWSQARGQSETSGYSDGHVSSDTESETWSESVADIPIYHPVPFLEGNETPWSLEEQRQRLADTLRLQLQRHCFVRTPDMRCRPVLVPKIEEVLLSDARVAAYEAELDRETGALPAEAVDVLIAERQRALMREIGSFLAAREAETVDLSYAVQSPTKLKRHR